MVEEEKLHECVVKDSPQQRGVSCSHSEIVVESSIQLDFDSNRPPRVISLLVVHGSLGQSVLERERERQKEGRPAISHCDRIF